MKAEVITYDEAVRRCGWHHSDDRTGEILPQLPYYGDLLTREIPPGTQNPNDPPEKRWGKITNPTVHIGLRQGFEMSQFSVYARFCNGSESYESRLKRIERNLPKNGEIHVLTFTDKQYENIVRFSSQRRKRPRKNPDQLALF